MVVDELQALENINIAAERDKAHMHSECVKGNENWENYYAKFPDMRPPALMAIARIMERHMLTRHQLAKILGVTPRTLHRWFRGESAVPLLVLRYLRIYDECLALHSRFFNIK